MKYTEIENPLGSIIAKEDKNGVISFIPKNESNSDYQRYLRWLENPNAEERGGLN